jgi:hypothetical protein
MPSGRRPARTNRESSMRRLCNRRISSNVSGFLPAWRTVRLPSLESVPRRPFPFDRKTGATVREEEETRGACNEMCASPANRLARFCGEVKRDKIFQSLGSAYHRTEARGPEKVIAYTMPAGRARFAGEVGLRIEKVDDCSARRVIGIKRPSSEDFVQVPSAAHQHSMSTRHEPERQTLPPERHRTRASG